MPYLDREGVRIYYEEHGDGPTLLLSHGYTSTGQMWDSQVFALSKDFRILVWDMRGHGRSDSPEDPTLYSEELTVGDMAGILDICGASAAFIGGLSLGGYMSLAFYRRYPERSQALLLFDTGPGYKSDTARAAWNEHAESRARDLEDRGLEALNQSPEVAASRHRGAQGLALAARGMLAQRDSTVMEMLPEIAVPTLVVVGAEDTPFLAATDYMTAKIPQARKVVIPDAGHASNIDQPELFNRALRSFLESLPG